MYKYAIGQKVVFIGGAMVEAKRPFLPRIKTRIPDVGEIVTIRDRDYFPDDASDGHTGRAYVLDEYRNPPLTISRTYPGRWQELFIDEEFFRPLKDTSKEVENLIRLGDPSKWTQEDRERFMRGAVKPSYVLEKEKT